MTETLRLNELRSHLERQVAAAHLASQKPLTAEQVGIIVRDVIQALAKEVSSADMRFYAELEALAQYIRQAKNEIAKIQPKDINTNYIPNATDELDAVVGATEEATNKIMDVCDEISVLAEQCSDDVKEKLIACTTKVFEACNFQDITGQRITKVVETLKHIDHRVEALVLAMGDEISHGEKSEGVPTHSHAGDSEKALLNGPQLPRNAIDQDEIDRLLSGQ